MTQKLVSRGRHVWDVLTDQEIINRTKFRQAKKNYIERGKEKDRDQGRSSGCGGWGGERDRSRVEVGKDAIQI